MEITLSAADKKRLAPLVRKIKKEEKIISDSRDRLRDLIAEVEAIIDSSDNAVHDLQNAAYSLSQYL